MKQDQKKIKNLELKGIQQLEEITELRAREELIKEKLKIEKLERDREKQLYEINKVQKKFGSNINIRDPRFGLST